jgi:hypothetical protein
MGHAFSARPSAPAARHGRRSGSGRNVAPSRTARRTLDRRRPGVNPAAKTSFRRRDMNVIQDLPGTTVLIQLEDQAELGFVGIPDDGPFFCNVVEVDQIGIWVENKRFMTTEIQDTTGAYIKKSRQKPKRHTVHILFPWRIIRTVVRFTEQDAGSIIEEATGGDGATIGRIGFLK